MCIIFFGRNENGLFILFNRDEHLGRESIKLEKINLDDFNSDHHNKFSENILYCKDCITNGTFFAINSQTFNFCFLLNHDFLDNIKRKKRRGIIPLIFCSLDVKNEKDYSSLVEKVFINNLKIKENEYKGFNLVFGNLKYEKVYYYTNNSLKNSKFKYPFEFDLKIKENEFPVYGNSNDYLDYPDEKVTFGIDYIHNYLNKEKIMSIDLKNESEYYNNFYKTIYEEVMFNSELKYRSKEEKNLCEEKIEKIISDKKLCSANKYFSNVYEEIDIDNYFANSIFVKSEIRDIITCYGNRQSYFIQKSNNNIIIREKFPKIKRTNIADYEKINDVKINLATFEKYRPESIYSIENYDEYRSTYNEIILEIC